MSRTRHHTSKNDSRRDMRKKHLNFKKKFASLEAKEQYIDFIDVEGMQSTILHRNQLATY